MKKLFLLVTFLGNLHAVYAPLPVERLTSQGAWGMAFDASLLVWQAREGGLEFAAKNNPLYPGSTSISVNINAELLGLDFAWEPAFKVNALWQSYTSGWDVDLRWTSFYTHSTHRAEATLSGNGSGLLPLWLLPLGNGSAAPLFGSATGLWQMHLNAIDWEIGHAYQVSRDLSLRIAGGLKMLLIEQLFRVHYKDGFSGFSNQVVSGSVVMKNDSWGLGPRMGISSRWKVGKGISLRAISSGFLELSQFRVTRRDEDVSVTVPSSFQFVKGQFKRGFWVYRPGLECLLGVGWETEWKRALLGLEAAYEMQYFWEQNMLSRSTNGSILYADYSSRGDLILQGLTWTFRCGF